jgi:hypothetical protein
MINREDPKAVLTNFINDLKGEPAHKHFAIRCQHDPMQFRISFDSRQALFQSADKLGTKTRLTALIPAPCIISVT